MRKMSGWAKGLSAGLLAASALEAVRLITAAALVAGVVPDTAGSLVYGGATVALLVVWLAAVAGLAAFTWRSVANIRSYEPDFHETPGAATVGWFIPGWNLYKPYDTLNGIWTGLALHPVFGEPEPPGRLLEVFWVSWVVAVVVGRLFAGGSDDALVGYGDVFAAGASLVSALAGARLIQRLGAMQDRIASA